MKHTQIALAVAIAFGGGSFSAALAQSGAPQQLPEVRVTGTTPAREAQRQIEAEQALTPGGVTVVDGEENYQRNVMNLADLMRYVPGMFATNAGGSEAAFISSRGSNLDAVNYDMNGIKMLQDGLPVTTADGNNHNRFIDPMSARHVIVARGANALTYGASTLGGAIDFISATALNGAPREVFLSAGSHGQVRGRFSVGGVSGTLDGMATVEGLRYRGFREHSRHERASLYANAGLQVSDKVSTRFFVTHINSDQELPGVLTRAQFDANPSQGEANAIAGHYQINVATWRLANKTTWNIDANSSFSVGFSYEEQSLYHPIVQNPFFSLLIDTKQRNLGAAARYNLRHGEHDMLFGLNSGWTKVTGGNYANNAGNRTFLRTAVVNKGDGTEAFAMDRWRFAQKWTAVYGAQAVFAHRNVHETDVAPVAVRNPKDHYSSLNPRAGVIYHLAPGVDLFANASRLYEAPTNYQLRDNVAGGNSTLRPMRGQSFEVGTRGRLAHGTTRWHWDLAYYHARLRDEILSRDDPTAPGTSLSTNFARTTHAGVEALLGASFAMDGAGAQRIEPLVNLTVNDFKFDNDGVYGNNRLPAAPRHAVRAELLYRNANGFFAGPTLDVVADRWADFSNTYKVESYALLGLRAGFKAKDWEVYGELRNLADKEHISYHRVVDVAAANAALLYPGEPRSAHVGVRLRF